MPSCQHCGKWCSEEDIWCGCAGETMTVNRREYLKMQAENQMLRDALGRIEQGCSFPSSDVERAIRDVAREALKRPAGWPDEQKAAAAKAIFDNDYSDMKRLKAEGRWISATKWKENDDA